MLDTIYRYPIALDMGNHQICAAQLKETRKGLAVRELFYQEYSGGAEAKEETAEALLSVLKKVSKNKQFQGKKVTAHLPSWDMVSFPIRFQVGREETVAFNQFFVGLHRLKVDVTHPLEGSTQLLRLAHLIFGRGRHQVAQTATPPQCGRRWTVIRFRRLGSPCHSRCRHSKHC